MQGTRCLDFRGGNDMQYRWTVRPGPDVVCHPQIDRIADDTGRRQFSPNVEYLSISMFSLLYAVLTLVSVSVIASHVRIGIPA